MRNILCSGRSADQRIRDSSTDVLQLILDAIKQSSRSQRTFSSTRKPMDISNIECWECKERGHRWRECPKLNKAPEVSHQGNEE